MKSQYIYVLLDGGSNPFYVGKSIDPQKRFSRHLSNTRLGAQLYVNNKIRKLLSEGMSVTVSVLEETDNNNVDARERHNIARLRDEGCQLCNLTDGGEGGMTPAIVDKIQASKRRNGTTSHSEATKAKMSIAAQGKPKSAAHCIALSKAWYRTPEQLKKQQLKSAQTSKGAINIKRYICISPEGVEHHTHRGLTKFCEDNELQSTCMHKVLKGERSNHKGWTIRRDEQEIFECQS